MFNLIIGGIFVAVVIYVLWVKGIFSFKWLNKFKTTKTNVEDTMKADVSPIEKSEIVVDHVTSYMKDETDKLLASRANADHLAKSIEQATAVQAKVAETKPEVKAPVKTATKTATKSATKTASKIATKTSKSTTKTTAKKGSKRK